MSKRALLVEGKDDFHVIKNICRHHNLSFDFIECRDLGEGGVDRLIEQIPVRLKQSDLSRLSIVLDADENLESRWRAICGRLQSLGFRNPPAVPRPSGTILQLEDQFRSIRFSVWIMPDNVLPGLLEDFLAFLIEPSDRLLPHVNKFIDSILGDGPPMPTAWLPKARLHSYLAVKPEPGKPLGLAITYKYLDADVKIVAPFVKWLEDSLFKDHPETLELIRHST